MQLAYRMGLLMRTRIEDGQNPHPYSMKNMTPSELLLTSILYPRKRAAVARELNRRRLSRR